MSGVLQERCLEAQTAIIGSMLIDDRCIGNVLSEISADDFPSGPHKMVFGVIKQLFTSGEPVDPVIVGARLDKAYQNFLAQCMEVTPTAAHTKQYCEILRRDSRLLQLQDLGEQLRTVSELDAARDLAAKVNVLMVEQSEPSVASSMDLATDFYRRMNEKKKPKYITTGFSGLDRKLFIEPGDVVGIGASPSTGKTAFALQWAAHCAKEYRVGFYSLETSNAKLADRIISRLSEVPLPALKKRILDQDEWVQIGQACTDFSGLNIEFTQAAGMTAQDIMSLAISRRQQIVFVDYLQLVSSASRSSRTALEVVSESSMTFHLAAQKNKITVVLLSQLSRPKKENGSLVPPDMHSFRESGQIEQDIDVAFLMYLTNPDDYRSPRCIKIGKNKEGEKGSVELPFDGTTQRFGPPPKQKKAEAQMSIEEKYAASEQAGKDYEIVDEPVPF